MVTVDLDVFSMTPAERCRATILLVEPNTADRSHLKACLRSLGFVTIVECPSQNAALDVLGGRRYSHILFDAIKGTMSPDVFVSRARDINGDDTVIIATSHEPQLDDVIGLVTKGARGYLRKPFSVDLLEEAVELATKGDPIHEAVLNAEDRNEALLSVVVATMDKAADIAKQAKRYHTASRELPSALQALRRSVYFARTFAKGGEEGYFDALVACFSTCADEPSSRLGKVRQRLNRRRSKNREKDKGG
jgi:CheY-like chemotaxis protein